MKILLIGNPNVGKTTLFNALTGAHNRTGNYHGVTVGVSERQAKPKFSALGKICDLPGLYSFDGLSMEEKLAGEYIDDARRKGEEILAMQVADAAHLPRAIKLTKALLLRGLPVTIAVTMCEKYRRRGGKIDCEKLSACLGVKCLEADALNKKSVAAFVSSLGEIAKNLSAYEKACERAAILKTGISALTGGLKLSGYAPAEGKESLLMRLSLDGRLALPIFFAIAAFVFFCTFGKGMPGDLAKRGLEGLFRVFSRRMSLWIGNPTVRGIVCNGVIEGLGSVFSFLPQIALLYLFSDILEESGFMSALAFTTDGFFAKIGLSGRAAFSVLLGYGCTAAAIASTRALEDKKAQRRAAACLYFVPCSAKLPVYLTLISSVFSNAFAGAMVLYVLGTGMGLLFAAFLKAEEEPFIMEIADIYFPSPKSIFRKLLFQLKGFAVKVSCTVSVFTVAVWLLSSFGVSGACTAEDSFLAAGCKVLQYLFYPMGIRDWRAAFAAVSGLIAKENIAGMIAVLFPEGLHFSLAASCAYLAFVALIPPCVSAVTACGRELGGKIAWGFAAAQTAFAFLCAYLVYFLLSGGAAVALPVMIAAGGVIGAAYLLRHKGRKNERIYRR